MKIDGVMEGESGTYTKRGWRSEESKEDNFVAW
jgi:hypothetical protein